MADLQSALEVAVFARLDAQITGATVYQYVPQDAGGSLVMLALFNSTEVGGKDSDLFRFSFSIATEVNAKTRKDLTALQAQVLAALNGWKPTATATAVFGDVTFETADSAQSQDARTYYGTQNFSVFVQPA